MRTPRDSCRWRRLLTFREFIRTPGAVFWTYGFPLILALSLGFAFRASAIRRRLRVRRGRIRRYQRGATRTPLREQPATPDPRLVERGGRRTRSFGYGRKFLLVLSRRTRSTAGCRQIKLRPGATAIPNSPRLQVERTHAGAEARRNEPPPIETVSEVTTPGWRYIDWLIPGLIGLNLIGAPACGASGSTSCRCALRNILRRLMVTPMHKLGVHHRVPAEPPLVLVIPEAGVIVAFGSPRWSSTCRSWGRSSPIVPAGAARRESRSPASACWSRVGRSTSESVSGLDQS